MMKQNRWKKSVAALTMAGVLALGMAAGAAVVRQKITAELRPDITVSATMAAPICRCVPSVRRSAWM